MTKQTKDEAARLPAFASEAAAGEFWDTNSPLDFPEEYSEVQVKITRPLIKRGLTVKLDDETLQSLTELAKEKGIGPSTLARMWIKEHLRKEKQPANA